MSEQLSEQFETNISQNLVDTQNQMRKQFSQLEQLIQQHCFMPIKSLEERMSIVHGEIVKEQKIRTKLEADLQVAQFAIRSLQEDVRDIQERLNEEFKPKKSLFSFFKT